MNLTDAASKNASSVNSKLFHFQFFINSTHPSEQIIPACIPTLQPPLWNSWIVWCAAMQDSFVVETKDVSFLEMIFHQIFGLVHHFLENSSCLVKALRLLRRHSHVSCTRWVIMTDSVNFSEFIDPMTNWIKSCKNN